jgi:hypothetical protein
MNKVVWDEKSPVWLDYFLVIIQVDAGHFGGCFACIRIWSGFGTAWS